MWSVCRSWLLCHSLVTASNVLSVIRGKVMILKTKFEFEETFKDIILAIGTFAFSYSHTRPANPTGTVYFRQTLRTTIYTLTQRLIVATAKSWPVYRLKCIDKSAFTPPVPLLPCREILSLRHSIHANPSCYVAPTVMGANPR
jgi:hypothetical protein